LLERDIANQLLRRHASIVGLPIDPVAIARAEGIDVLPFPEMPTTASGWFRIIDGQPTIYFNQEEPSRRQRFTVAHELGHYALGHGERPRDNASAFNVRNYDPYEAGANKFAAELLMPAERLRAAMLAGISDLARLATGFGVSEVAMRYRLKNLGWIS
jgi:Zn-dependent peptidase ImmA (M78 family)